MGLMDVFKANENKRLQDRVAELEALLSPDKQAVMNLRDEIARLEQQSELRRKEGQKAEAELAKSQRKLEALNAEIEAKRAKSSSMDEMLLFESFGIYTPRFRFTKSEQYKARLDDIRQRQKTMINNNTAVLGAQNWTVNGSASQGKKMVKDMQKLLLRAFNSECDELVEKVKYNNYEASLKRIKSSRDAISKLGAMMNISISESYLSAKIDELTLAFEYATKKQEEKEAEKEARARLREEARLQKEIEEERRKIEKEQTHYLNALARLNAQISANPTDPELLAKRRELEERIADADRALQEVDYREANKRAGYVYVISNVGAFGENVYKIGMTRRLDPQERVDELGDASVPFNFDVHAMIFTDDAPKLEAALHKAFEDKKVNMVNPRREFFHVSLNEIKAVIRRNYDKTVEFNDYPEAEQWRVSARMRGEKAVPAPKFPNGVENSTAETTPAPVPQTAPREKNLAEKAIEIIHSKHPSAVCPYTIKDGIYTIRIKDVGVLRVSNFRKIKCDFFGIDKTVYFFGGLEKINDMI